MDPLNDAEANLRTIRQLMERATTYRAISGPVALVAGLLSCLNCFFFAYIGDLNDTTTDLWICSWYLILIFVLLLNALLLYLNARKLGEQLLNPRSRLALQALSPALIVGLLSGLRFFWTGGFPEVLWVTFYGLALSSMSGFAPKSLRILGWSVTATGVAFWIGLDSMLSSISTAEDELADLGLDFLTEPRQVTRLLPMIIGFGLTHIFYAACVPWKIAPDDRDD